MDESNVKWEFTLERGHILLAEQLEFRTELYTPYGHDICPSIYGKNPIGGDDAIYDACCILEKEYGFTRDEESGCGWKKEDWQKAEKLLIGLPVALTIILERKTFEPGAYDVSEYPCKGRYREYLRNKGFLTVKDPFDKAKSICEDDDDLRKFYELLYDGMSFVWNNLAYPEDEPTPCDIIPELLKWLAPRAVKDKYYRSTIRLMLESMKDLKKEGK